MNEQQILEQLWFSRAKFLSDKYSDGDTVWIMLDMGMRTYAELSVRIYGVNTPELTDKNEEIRKAAFDAKQATIDILKAQGEYIYLKTFKPDPRDKYGRYLADIFLFNDLEGNPIESTLSEYLVKGGFAKEYMV